MHNPDAMPEPAPCPVPRLLSVNIGAARLLPGIATLSPLQDLAATMALPTGPVLAILEDATGAAVAVRPRVNRLQLGVRKGGLDQRGILAAVQIGDEVLDEVGDVLGVGGHVLRTHR